jgi:hypothetical protein
MRSITVLPEEVKILMFAFLGSHYRISGLFLLNPEDAQNRRNLAKIFREVP